jgi:preprotein translocase subunit SecG
MENLLLTVHLLIAAALVGVVLVQKSEGGALGIGGGGGGGGFLSGRGTANLLSRTTAVLAGLFFATSIALTVLANGSSNRGSAFDRPATTAPAQDGKAAPLAPVLPGETGGGVLGKLQQGRGGEALPQVPGTK